MITQERIIPRPLSAAALAAIGSTAEVCDILRAWGRPDLAARIAYFASDEDLDDDECPVTLDSARDFLALFGAIDADAKLELACSPEGWISAEWYFGDARIATIHLWDSGRAMFAARRADGRFTDFGIGSEYADLPTIMANMVAAGILKWYQHNRKAENSRLATA